MELSDLPPGIYLAQFVNDDQVESQKLIIQ